MGDELGKIGDYISSGGLEHSRRIAKREEEQTRSQRKEYPMGVFRAGIPMEPVNYANVELPLQIKHSVGEDMLSSVLLFIDDLLR